MTVNEHVEVLTRVDAGASSEYSAFVLLLRTLRITYLAVSVSAALGGSIPRSPLRLVLLREGQVGNLE